MTSKELRDLVKAHFSLVEAEVTPEENIAEETFGRIADENGAFEIVFPGDSLQIGDKVTVVTSDDQEMSAPDGEHKLSDGTKIVTKDSVVEEIMGADGEKAMAELEPGETPAEETSAEEFDARTDAEEEGYLDGIADEKADEKMSVEDIVEAIVSEVKEEMKEMKTKMAELEDTVAKVMDVPAAEATKMTSTPAPKAKFSTFNVESAKNADRIKAMTAQIKNKKNK